MECLKDFVSNLQPTQKDGKEPELLQEFVGVDLGDSRLERRLLNMVGEFNTDPSAGTVNSTMKTWASSKAAYRFFSNENVKAEKLIRPHILQTQTRMKQYEYVLAVSDTTYINYNNLKKTVGLGSIGGYKKGANHSQGIILHATYTISPEGLPLGILANKVWTRPPEGYASDETREENKESERWTEQMLEAKEVYPENTKMIYVADRESDIYELFETAKKEEIGFVVRSKHNRKIEGDRTNIKTALSQERPKGQITIEVAEVNTSKKKRKKRKAVLEIKSSEVYIADSGNNGKDAADKKYEKVNVVLVEEKNPPSEEDKIEWRLLTTLPVEEAEECVKVVEIYRERWKIELFFKVMKSGCSIENCRLRNANRIIRYLFIMSVLSWRISWMVYVNRIAPAGHYSLVVTELEYKTLWLMSNRDKIKSGKCGKAPPDSEPWTVRDTIRAMAGIAGFNGRKGDGEPGMQKVWEGWIKLQYATLATEVLLS